MFGKTKQALTRIGAFTLAVAAPAVFAAEGDVVGGGKGIDLTPLTNSVNFGSVLTGIMAVAGSLIVLYAGSAGVRWILRMVRGA
ncbi:MULTISPECIES: hypothetical protein [Enterobacterales]|uniref:hypothetical protein n=1 Tax=Enterobacterales TaxID=91347 RepID=UPI000735AA64|nr:MULTISPECIES: hypothetical protein [Enterobacterales]ELZ7781373.1 hypothetical protein [Salmonella enterica]KTI05508.1 hypothetical protein ASV13_10435 [Enterobacter hormaechei subsp. steigerwaltii]KVI95759.1 hypothetical protein AWS42_12070 [Enterobacter hormaechei subsp. hoffmannii]MBL9241781.1 hypothetical protein [Escherichia coli]MCW8230611.1 hypothetical protein [Klebsiella pneumoniae]